MQGLPGSLVRLLFGSVVSSLEIDTVTRLTAVKVVTGSVSRLTPVNLKTAKTLSQPMLRLGQSQD